MGRFFGVLGVFFLLITAVTLRFPHVVSELQSAITGDRFEMTEGNRQRFRADALLKINDMRSRVLIPELSIDSDLQDSLVEFVNATDSPSSVELALVFEHLQAKFPGAQFLSANVCHSLTNRGMIDALTAWTDVTSTDYESISTVLFKEGRRLGCIAVLSKRLPEFDVAAASQNGGRFFNRCPHCARTHAVELDRKSRTLVLACPDCSQPYDVLAADTEGRFYRACDFMLGFQLPRVVGSGIQQDTPDEKLLLHIWKTIVDHCEYQNDNSRAARREAWKTPDQTWLERAGDCEDTSILLADSLISAGIEARVAVGWNSTIGQHAWCVARIGNKQYLLESTIEHGKDIKLTTTAEAAREYRPEQLFDRDRLYFHGAHLGGTITDYWDTASWKAVLCNKDKRALTLHQPGEAE